MNENVNHLEKLVVELRTPLTSILGFTGSLARDTSLSPEQANLVRIIRNEARKMAAVLSEMDSTPTEELRATFTTIGVAGLIEELTAFCRVLYPDREFRCFYKTPEQPLCTDGEIVRSVLLELLSNAVKFSPEGTTIALQLTETNSAMELTVFDNGPGIDPEDLPHLGERFFRSQSVTAEGSGLGLYLARRRLSLVGGTLVIKSQPGMGAAMTVSLPKNNQE
jgi:signal transduction histidine kinase